MYHGVLELSYDRYSYNTTTILGNGGYAIDVNDGSIPLADHYLSLLRRVTTLTHMFDALPTGLGYRPLHNHS